MTRGRAGRHRRDAGSAAGAREPLLVVDALRAFLDDHGLGSGDLAVAPIGEGHSNVTYLVTRADGCEVVLRRPPRGPLAPSTHDVLREARLLRALDGTAARVPRVLAACDDAVRHRRAVLPHGARPRRGRSRARCRPRSTRRAQRRRCGEELVDALAEVHAVDWRACGLEGFSSDPGGYLERQLRRFARAVGAPPHARRAGRREVGGVAVARTCRARAPRRSCTATTGSATSCSSATAPARLLAIFDWELATLGDPLADVGYLCALWSERDDPTLGAFELSGVTREPGLPRRATSSSRATRPRAGAR